METSLECTRAWKFTQVLTVPMRNGNTLVTISSLHSAMGSYRTYEEWKRNNDNSCYTHQWVLTVPMRNGNFMLTIFSIIFMKVLTVPMRNGNIDVFTDAKSLCKGSYRTYEEWKRTSEQIVQTVSKSSYRTYEEWKPHTCSHSFFLFLRFLPYLWGMETLKMMLLFESCKSSYRTYEEWKLS